MTIYLVVEDFDYGPGYNLGSIIAAFKSKDKADSLSKGLNDKDATFNQVDDKGLICGNTYYPPFRVMEIELEDS